MHDISLHMLFAGCLVSAVILSGVGCQKPVERPDDLLAIVGDVMLTGRMIEETVGSHSRVSERARQDYVNRWIDHELLYRQAEKQGLQKDPTLLREMDRIERDLMVRALVEQEVDRRIRISDADIQSYYEQNPSQFLFTQDEFTYRQVSTTSLREARVIGAFLSREGRLPNEDSFEEETTFLVADYSENFIQARNLETGLPKLLKSLEPEEFSKRTKLGDRYYYVQLLAMRLQGAPIPLPENVAQIRSILQATRRKQRYQELLNRLREETKNEIFIDVPDDHDTATAL